MTTHLEQRFAEIAEENGFTMSSMEAHWMRLGAEAAFEWMPIESAPMNEWILCHYDKRITDKDPDWVWTKDDCRTVTMRFCGEKWGDKYDQFCIPPHLWRPLPPPPKEPSDERD